MKDDGGDLATAAAAAGDEPLSASLSDVEFQFGWVPAEVVRALLEEVGNFRTRAAAIEQLHAAVLDARHEPGALLPTLSAFLAFWLRLVGDANFKIAISAMTIMVDLVAALGADVEPYLGMLAAPLIERLGDSVQLVRQAAAHAFAALARALGPAHVLAAIGGALVHPSWRVREGGVNVYTAALLGHPKEQFDYPACVRALAGAAADEQPRVAAAALEAFALLHVRLGALLQGLLTAVGVADSIKSAVAERVHKAPQLGLPSLDAQGIMQHQEHARPPSAQRRPKPAAGPAPQATAAPPASAADSTPAAAALKVAGVALVSVAPVTGATHPSKAAPTAAHALLPPGQPVHSQSAGATWLVHTSPPASPSMRAHSWSPAAAAAYIPAADYALMGSAFADSAGSFSGPSPSAAHACAEYGGYASAEASQFGHASFSMGGTPPPFEADSAGGAAVEQSGGSLLNWQRPGRRPNQLSFTGPPGSATVAVGKVGNAGGKGIAEAAQPQRQPSKVVERSLSQTGKPRPGLLQSVASAPLPAAAARRAVPPQAAGIAAQPAAQAAAAGYNADLYSSVRNWQQQRQGSSTTLADGDDASSGGSSQAGLDSRAAGMGQDTSLAVEPRSDSLLQWRLPKRANCQKAPARHAAAGVVPPSPASPARIGSGSFKRAFSGFTKKLFGGEAGPQEQQPQAGAAAAAEQQAGAGTGSSVPALHQAALPLVQCSACTTSPILSVVVPDATECCNPGQNAAATSLQFQQHHAGPAGQAWPESPIRGGADNRLSRLKQLSERRRVWSAPAVRPLAQPEPAHSGAAALEAMAAAPGSPGAGPMHAAFPMASALPADGAAAEGSPGGGRPGLQALKARARTARISSITSLFVPPPTAGDGCSAFQPYSMEAVDDVFGPDQPVLSSMAPRASGRPWSPLKTTGSMTSSSSGSSGGSGAATPPRPSALTGGRGGSNSGSTQWPDSPSGVPASPSGRTLWRTPSHKAPETLTAAASPTALLRAESDASAAGGFSPTSDTSPLAQPEAALQHALAALQDAALAQKKELNWQAQYEALRTVRRLALHHAAVLAPPPTVHALVALAAPVVDALRSTMSRLAISVFQSLAEALGPALDAELDAFVPLLLKRAGQVSISGRDNFLAVEADQTLAAVAAHAGDARVASALLNGLASKSPDVRAKAALHLETCLQQHGSRWAAAGSGGGGAAGLLPRVLRAAVALLDEGGLVARTAGKRMLWELRRLLDGGAAGGCSGGDDFKRVLARLDCKTEKVLESGRMPAGPSRLPSAGLRTLSGSGPASPTATIHSHAKPGILTAGSADTTPPLSRAGSSNNSGGLGGAVSSGAGVHASAAGVGSAAGPNSAGGASAATASAGVPGVLPPPRWHPSRPGSKPGPGGQGKGAPSACGTSASAGAPARRGSSRPGSAGVLGPVPAGSLAGLEPDLQQRLEGAAVQLGSTEWKARVEGLEAVQAAVGARAGDLPLEAQLWLADALKERVVDANLKVQQQVLSLLNGVLDSTGASLAPAAPALLPAMCNCLGSTNPSVRLASGQALDAVLRTWPADAYLSHLMASLAAPAGPARGKEALTERLALLAPPLWQSRPALVRQHVLPALFSLLAASRRPELRQLAQGTLVGLAGVMGAELAAAAATSPLLGAAQQQIVADVVAAARGSNS